MITIALLILLFGIFFTPSGPECPKCGSYLTAHMESTSLNGEVKLCFKCGNKWDKIQNGEKVDEFIQERSTSEEDDGTGEGR